MLFVDTWLPVRSLELENHRGHRGYLASIVPVPVETITDSMFYSLAVIVLDDRRISMCCLGRIEWLCVQVVTAARRYLLATRSDPRSYIWRPIEEKTRMFGNTVEIHMLIAPTR